MPESSMFRYLDKKKIEKIFQCFEQINPNPQCELIYFSPYQLLVSVILSAQTTDKMVNRVMEPLYKNGFDESTVLKLGITGLKEKIKSIGLAPSKAKNIFNMTKILVERFQKKIPHQKNELLSLPGVGKKTANVILAELFNEPVLAVDTHVYRVTYRLGFHQEKTPEKAEAVLLQQIPIKYLPRAHHWFILHGRYTCKARKPDCGNCKIKNYCNFIL